jgi:two-component sensor histidine kinase
LYSVLTELYSNALEHGVLGLDSELKRDARGFAQYYRQRNERLAALDSGFVRLQLRVTPEGNGGGRLTIRVEDSGNGFDVPQVLARPTPSQGLSGRGVSLVRQLSERAEWAEDGRSVCVEFAWRSPAGG